MDDNMLLVTGIGFLILSALLVYLGVRLFMLLFKKCEQNRKHQVIFFAVLLFIFACCGCVLFWDPAAPFACSGMLCLLFSEPKVSFITMPTWDKILPALLIIIFSLCCIITAVILLIRKKFICGSILLGYTAALVCFAYSISPVKIMDDNMLLVIGIGFLSALLVYLGVRLFMLLFKKCEQNRKHLAIYLAIHVAVSFVFCCIAFLCYKNPFSRDVGVLIAALSITGICAVPALLVYLGVRLFMLLFKKCEQNRKHLAIFIIIFLFVTAILCAATYLYDLFLALSLGSYVCCMPHLAELLLMLMPLLLFVIPFALSCFVSFVVLLIRKKLSSVTFLLCGILLCIFVMFHSPGKMILFSERCRHCGINPRSYCERIITSHCIECHKAYQQRAHCSAINVYYSAGVEGKCPECVSEWMIQHRERERDMYYDTSTER